MNGSDETNHEIELLGKRLSALSAAILRISASLDLATVLQDHSAAAVGWVSTAGRVANRNRSG